ncbi:hypothetical protein BH09SUM1_BH09SUM1_17320 [soil metagenome]
MSVTAIYKNGVLELLEPTDLKEDEKVSVEITREADRWADTPLWDRFGLGLLGSPGPDFKELGEEWREYTE